MRRVTKVLGTLAAALIAVQGNAFAAQPSVARLDAVARALGNRRATAVAIGERLFTTAWPAQVLNVGADGVGSRLIVGLRLSGVHFHRPLTRAAFDAEVAALVAEAFAAAPQAEEVDLWTSIPIPVPKGTDVSGDLAMPAWRTVFTISVRRTEVPGALAERLANGKDLFVDEDWARTAFKRTRRV